MSTSDDFPTPHPLIHLLLPQTQVFLPHRDLLVKCHHKATISLCWGSGRGAAAVGRSVHSLSQRQNRERSSQGQLTNRYKAKRQRDRNLEASHQ